MTDNNTIEFLPSLYSDNNGRYANAFVFTYSYSSMGEYAGRFPVYKNITMTKTSKDVTKSTDTDEKAIFRTEKSGLLKDVVISNGKETIGRVR